METLGDWAKTPPWEGKNRINVEKRIRMGIEVKVSNWKSIEGTGRNWTTKSKGKTARWAD